MVAASAAVLWSAPPAHSQEADIAPEFQCLRYLQSYERSMRIPQGLLTAISFVESGRAGPNGEMTAWPWTINVNGDGRYFETKEAAVAETRKLLDDGQRSIDVGCMQINLRYHPNAFTSIDDAFEPALNVAYGAQFLKSLHQLQGSWTKAVERYHSSDDGRREEYRERVLGFWNNEARMLVMNAVIAENTDTPYHRAVRDFAAGRYEDAVDKYQAILDLHAKDRIGLLGLAMSYEQLGRASEALEAYARYLAAEPRSEGVLSHVLRKAMAKSAADARTDLEVLVKAGVNSAEVNAVLAELASTMGDNETAFSYASSAIQQAPDVTMNYLNAGVLADRLNRPAVAVSYYEQFLTLMNQRPTMVDTPVAGIRERVRYLRTLL